MFSILLRSKFLIFVFQAGGFVGDDSTLGTGGACCARVESSYIINLRDLEMKHVKDFVFINGGTTCASILSLHFLYYWVSNQLLI